MANRQQLSILKQGTLPWNDWRKKNPDVRPDLYEASLAGANLHGANLSGANLGGAELSSTDPQEVNLPRIRYIRLPVWPALSSQTPRFTKVSRKNCVLSYRVRQWLCSRCSMEAAGCLACFPTSSNTPTSSLAAVTIAWQTYKQPSRKKSSNLPKRKQRNWKEI